MRRFVKPIEEIFSDALGRLPLSTNMTGSGYQIVKDTEVDHECSDIGKELYLINTKAITFGISRVTIFDKIKTSQRPSSENGGG